MRHLFSLNVHRFIDEQHVRARDAIKIYFGSSWVTVSERQWRLPSLPQATRSISNHYTHLSLEPLVAMQLVINRVNNKVNCRDMINVGLINASWPARFDPILGSRLQELLDDPEG